MRIDEIWEELENDTSATTGMLLRRYSGVILPDVFIGLIIPEKIRCIAASVNSTISINMSSFSNLRDIQLSVLPDPHGHERNIILFKLLSNLHSDIFSVLCEDLMESIGQVTDDHKLVKELLTRFEKWKSLFDRVTSQGLTTEEQRGLYGELYLLRKFLNSIPGSYHNIISSWVGPDKQIKDFQYGNWALEVKCTSGNNHQKAQISSERQLDTSNLENLFLFHLSLEVRQHTGETLNQIIGVISDILSFDFIALNRFRSKLLEAGYFDQHIHIYEMNGYMIRQETFYRVEGDFPRIEERDIRDGVGDVKYSIILSQCSEFIRTEMEVLEKTIF
jgi:hypothetical protein